jgi:hypothetical protein
MKFMLNPNAKICWNVEGAGGGSPDGAPAADPAAPAPAPAPAAPAVDLSFVPADFHKDGAPDIDAFRAHYEGLVAEQTKRAEAPKAPEDGRYQFAIPDGLDYGVKLPEGMKIELAADDPAFAPIFEDLGKTMHELGLPQEAASRLVGLLARYKAAEVAKQYADVEANMAKLGATPAQRDARINTLERSLTNALPGQPVKSLMAAARMSEQAVRALEALVSKSAGPTAGTPVPANAKFDGLRGAALLKAVLNK